MTQWEHEEVFKFIDAYHNEETIWNPKAEGYKDRVQVREAWIRVSEIMGVPVAELKRKREALMATFRQHMKRKKASIASANSEDDIYQPKWVFYDAFEAFLADVYDCPRQERIINIEEFPIAEDGSQESEADNDSIKIQPQTTKASSHRSNQKPRNSILTYYQLDRTSHYQPPCQPDSEKIREASQHLELLETYKHMKFACNILSSEVSRPRNEVDDCNLFGKVVAKKLKTMPENDRQDLMLQIDRLLLNRKKVARDQYQFT